MKLLSLIVPCYNSAAYMKKCIDSLLVEQTRIEILIIDDGSKDATREIALAYQQQFPQIVKVISQANGGHGQAINNGLCHATGEYIKIVDSDDWLDKEAYLKVLDQLENFRRQQQTIDLLLTNYIYDKQSIKHKKVIHYRQSLPQNQIFTWNQVKFKLGSYFLMHALIYRRELLVEKCRLNLPKHTFYVDNLYAFEPLIFVKKMYYLDVNLYHYFIGRQDQSVNEKVMLGRLDQQLFVNQRMLDFYLQKVDKKTAVAKYLRRYLEIMTAISSILLLRQQTPTSLQQKQQLWQLFKLEDEILYRQLRFSLLGIVLNLPGKFGRKVALRAYRCAQKIYGFN